MDFWLSPPEVGLQPTLNAEMTELKFNVPGFFRKVSPNIIRPYMKSGDTMTFALRFDHHKVPAFEI